MTVGITHSSVVLNVSRHTRQVEKLSSGLNNPLIVNPLSSVDAEAPPNKHVCVYFCVGSSCTRTLLRSCRGKPADRRSGSKG